MNLKHFSYSEFDSPDQPGSGRKHMDEHFLKVLDEARDIAGVPFIVTSGYRTEKYNKSIGGVKNSAHTKGLAADIAAPDYRERKILDGIVKSGIPRIGLNDNANFFHVDMDDSKPSPRVWTY